jgi:threonine dehydrogenase-like Zn-dependent dehydrogenase
MPKTMQALYYVGTKRLEFRDVPAPALLADGDALVRPLAVARCDLEAAFFRHSVTPLLRAGIATHWLSTGVADAFGAHPFAGPFAVGHECVAEVVACGDSVETLKRGDVVVVPFQISCGACPQCSKAWTAQCSTDRRSAVAAFGGFADPANQWGGAAADLLRVPYADHMLIELPRGSRPEVYASAGDNIVDGYRAVGPQLLAEPGAPVLVLGGQAKSVGLYAVGLAKALGASEVVYVDHDSQRLQIAECYGATSVERSKGLRAKVMGTLRQLRHLERRFPIVVEASGSAAGLALALAALTPQGVCTVVGFHWRRTTPVPLWDMYLRNLRLETGLVHARSELPKVVNLIASGRFDPSLVTTTVASWADAPRAFLDPGAKVVMSRRAEYAPA